MDPENINRRKAGYWKVSMASFVIYAKTYFSSLTELRLCEGRAEVIESYQQAINERFALLKDIHMNRPSGAKEPYDSLEKVTGKELVSSVSRFHNYIIFSDTG